MSVIATHHCDLDPATPEVLHHTACQRHFAEVPIMLVGNASRACSTSNGAAHVRVPPCRHAAKRTSFLPELPTEFGVGARSAEIR
jgi:hypothetical protein